MRTNHTVDSEILRRFGAKNLRDSWYAKTNYALSYNCGEKTFPGKGRGLGLKCLRNESAEDEIYGIIEEWADGKLLAEIEALPSTTALAHCQSRTRKTPTPNLSTRNGERFSR